MTWGQKVDGGDFNDVHAALTGVDKIYSTHTAFSTVLKEGALVTWDYKHYGGDTNDVQAALRGVNEIYSTPYSARYSRVAAFAAVSKDVAAADSEKELLGLPPAKTMVIKLPAMLKVRERQNAELSRRLAELAMQEQVREWQNEVLSRRLA